MNSFLEKIVTTSSPLVALLSRDPSESTRLDAQRVGFTLSMDYEHAIVMINDAWRKDVYGIAVNSYLLAATFDLRKFNETEAVDKRVVLLRVIDKARIGTDDEHLRAITQYYQNNPDASNGNLETLEPLSRAQMQWSGVKCRILGTFFIDKSDSISELQLGTDVEDFFAAKQMRVFKPHSSALETIVNYVDPRRKAKAEEEAKQAHVGLPIPFEIGHVRFTSTQHMAAQSDEAHVPVRVSPVDFLARRTGVFGMTRTGKSNTTKTMVSEVAITAFETHQPIGQLIFDINGEYSNPNEQDGASSINNVFDDNTVRYRAMNTPGFRDLRSNFYDNYEIALELIKHGFDEKRLSGSSADLKTFLSLDLSEPEDQNDYVSKTRWQKKLSIFRAILKKAGYLPDEKNNKKQNIPVGKKALASIYDHGLNKGLYFKDSNAITEEEKIKIVCHAFQMEQSSGKGQYVLSLDNAVEFWQAVRNIEYAAGGYGRDQNGICTDPSKPWLDEIERGILSVLVGRSSINDNPIVSTNMIHSAGRDYHGPKGSSSIGQDVYKLLNAGRIVILDLSVGSPSIREALSKRLANDIFVESSQRFNAGERPPRIVIYIEEAHNLIGKTAELTEIWPRMAKEGAKYGIALVYATQEPSSVHPNILSNTENFFVTHLNNDDEIRALSRFYDFADFGPSLKRSQDVGFARIKMLSANFVTPTQIKMFNPKEIKKRYLAVKKQPENEWFSALPYTKE